MSLTGHHALVTGAGSGIGRATAERLAEAGCQVTLIGRHVARLNETADRIGNLAFAAPADVTDPFGVTAALEGLTQGEDGRLDLLVNNAGVLYMGPFRGQDLELIRRTVEVNLLGALTMLRLALPYLEKARTGAVVNLSSASAVHGIPELAVYSATKAALKSLTESLSLELAGRGIRVSAILPPFVATPLILEASAQATSVGRMGVGLTPEEVAREIWKAAHGRKVIRPMGLKFRLLLFLFWLAPFARRSLVKALSLGKEV